jgi:hypothetical protein
LSVEKFMAAFLGNAVLIVIGFLLVVLGSGLVQFLGIALMMVGVFLGIGADLVLRKD